MKENKELEAKLIEFRKNGFSIGEIAKMTGLKYSMVRKIVAHIKLSKDEISKKISCLRKEQENEKFKGQKIDREVLISVLKKQGAYSARKTLGKSYGCIQYWMKEYGIKKRPYFGATSRTNCQLCGRSYSDFKTKNKMGLHCNTCVSKIRRVLGKMRAIMYKGGKCEKCGFKATRFNMAAFEFHHDNEKNFTIGNGLNRKWEETQKEIDKCQLVCSNCHRVEHSDYNNEEIIRIASEKIKLYHEADLNDWKTNGLKEIICDNQNT